MDYKFLNKVLDQLVRETMIDYDRGEVESPFFSSYPRNNFLNHISSSSLFFLRSFVDHCRDVYGLNIREREYVWNEYKRIIKDKIKNNGL